MSLIETVHPEQATGTVAEVYRQIGQVLGRVPNGMRLYSASPALLREHWQLLGYYMRHPNLSPALLATVRLLVSEANDCEYCIDMNAGMLIGMFGLSPEQVAAIRRDPEAAPFTAKDKALLKLVLKTVVQRQPATRAELDALAALGWSSADVLDAVAHGARNVSVDVLLNAFAVENDF
jgi:AhpD family alkylhydroperoxidase